jgi:FKBP-type peptidyl-prolyl cis-trans isomerase
MPSLLRCLGPAALFLALGGCGGHRDTTGQDQSRFLSQTGKEKGVTTLASGLEYRVLRSGPRGGPHPAKGDEIKLDYTGSLLSGSVFDSTNATGLPAVLRLDGLIPAWMEALPKMRPGDRWLIYAPPRLGYGEQGRPPVIPPNSVLIFDVALIGVLHSDNDSVKFADRLPAGPSPQMAGPSAQHP